MEVARLSKSAGRWRVEGGSGPSRARTLYRLGKPFRNGSRHSQPCSHDGQKHMSSPKCVAGTTALALSHFGQRTYTTGGAARGGRAAGSETITVPRKESFI